MKKCIIICAIILVAIILFIIYYKWIRTTKLADRLYDNIPKHLYENTYYAHFSKITEDDPHKFPNLKKCTRFEITLNSGDMLYIPAGWWHWIESTGRTMAINFWWDAETSASRKREVLECSATFIPGTPCIIRRGYPYLTNKWSDQYLMSKINNVYVWNCKTDTMILSTMGDFIRDKVIDNYIITLDAFSDNQHVLQKLLPDVIIPQQISNTKPHINIWFAYNKVNSGLHYDDTDGLLCVITGRKKVILFPPEDKIYLDPFPLLPVWTGLLPDYNISYNTYKKKLWNSRPHDTSYASGMLLYLLCRNDNNLLKIADKLFHKYGSNKIIYGVKNAADNLRFEFYYYQLNHEINDLTIYNTFTMEDVKNDCNSYNLIYDKSSHQLDYNNLLIMSFDYESTASKKINKKTNIDVYYKISSGNYYGFPYVSDIYDYCKDIFKGSNLVDTYERMKTNLDYYLNRLNISHAHWIYQELDHYIEKENINMSLIKKGKEIGIGWFGVSYHMFHKFLKVNRWPSYLVMFWEEHEKELQHLTNEVIIHYDVNGNATRSAFYGVL